MKKIIYLALFLCIANFAKSQCPVPLSVDTSICTGSFSITVDASVLDTSLCSDSVTIFFNATGTGLAGDTNIYMHSAPQFYPFESWRDNYTVGNWGQNDGVGRMKSLGNNKWSITIQPQNYYKFTDSCLNGIWMVFRNATGTVQEPLSGATNDFLYTIPTPPTSTDTGVSGAKSNGAVTYLWSDNNTSRVRTFTSATNLTVTATSVGACTATGSVVIKTGHASVSLGSDVVRCNPNQPVTLNAGSGFTTYIWLNNAPNIDSTYTATNPGCYWITAIDAANCTSTAEVQVENSEVNNLLLPDTLASCPGGHVSVNASTNVTLLGDSIVIIYNAATGQTGLSGAAKVYMHSGPQLTPSLGWDLPYTVGDWGLDDGVGEMTSLGNNVWRIAIDPYCYYKINPDSQLTGLWMVFRNADGTETGKDPYGNNIYVAINNKIPFSTFFGVTASRTPRLPLTYTWSNNVTGPVNSFTTANTYTVTLSDNNNCQKTASVVATFNGTAPINLGADTTVCPGNTVTITAPASFVHYNWNNTDTTQSISVGTTATYSVTATDSIGCQSYGSRKVTISNTQVSIHPDTIKCTQTPTTLTTTGGPFALYQWMNGIIGLSSTYTANNPGPYWVKAVDNAGCASYDTISYHYSDVLGLSLPDTLNTCPGNYVAIDASTSIERKGDSLVINYNATLGQTGLIGATKVYFHSGPEFHPGGGWVGAYTVGDYGLDDGVGKMDSMGNNEWRITISPYDYYHVNPDTPMDGIYMIFRNANGTETGKDDNGNNIFLSLTGVVPTSTFTGLYAFRESEGNITFNWSIPNTTAPDIAVNTPGIYSVTATDDHGCTSSASVLVTNKSTLAVSLGNDTTVCYGQSVTLDPGNTYNTYSWSNGDTTEAITVSKTGQYAVSVTSGNCAAADTVTVTVLTHAVTLGSDIVRCNTSPVTLTASNGFLSYLWFGAGTSSQTYSAVHEGSYWVKATDGTGCVSYDTVTVTNSAVLNLSIPDSVSICSGTPAIVDASVNITAKGDSLVIVYDATKGQTGLVNAAKVYMHSAPEFTPSVGWQNGFTVGNWGLDNGIGLMDSLGDNKWTITIDPLNYYVVPPDSVLNGVFMVFRNATGSETGKDNNGGNILINLTGAVPVSSFAGVTGTRKSVANLTYSWTNNVTTALDSFTTGAIYTVSVSDGNSCSNSASVTVLEGQSPVLNLSPDTFLCGSSYVLLQADTGYTYVWSNGAPTSFIYINNPGTYSVTATNITGCSTVDSIHVSASSVPTFNLGSDSLLCSAITLYADSGFVSYKWNNDSTTSYLNVTTPGTYSVTVTGAGGCTGTASIHILTGTIPSFSLSSDSSLCNVSSIELQADTGFASYLWNTSNTGTHITVRSPGLYSVTVTTSGGCTGTSSINIEPCTEVGCGSPKAKFIVLSIDPGHTVTFENLSAISKTMSYEWNFGDGVTSADTGSIVHTYASTGVYEVSLIIHDSCGGVSADSISIDIIGTGISTITGLTYFNVYPNPSASNFNVEISLQQQLSASLILFNSLGQVVWQRDEEMVSGINKLSIDGSTIASGIYTLELIGNSERAFKKITLTK